MGSSSSTHEKSVQNVTNNLLQQTNQKINGKCTQIQSDNIAVISNITVGGNADVTADAQSCIQDISATMKVALDSQISTILSAMTKSDQKDTSSPISFTISSQDSNQTIVQNLGNKIQQIASASCSFSDKQVLSDSIIVISNITAGGNSNIVGFSQKSNQQSNCFITTSAKAIVHTHLTASEIAKQKEESLIAMFITLGIVFVIVLGIVALVFVYNVTKPDAEGDSGLTKIVGKGISAYKGGTSKSPLSHAKPSASPGKTPTSTAKHPASPGKPPAKPPTSPVKHVGLGKSEKNPMKSAVKSGSASKVGKGVKLLEKV
jgi:hypothetical protein